MAELMRWDRKHGTQGHLVYVPMSVYAVLNNPTSIALYMLTSLQTSKAVALARCSI